MLIKVCSHCKGNGFWRLPLEAIDDVYDLVDATMIYADGTRWPAISEGPIEDVPTGIPIAYDLPCVKCDGLGDIEWRRGGSLTPVLSFNYSSTPLRGRSFTSLPAIRAAGSARNSVRSRPHIA